MKLQTKVMLLSLGQFVLVVIFISLVIYQIQNIYGKYSQADDKSKKECFDKFKTFEYEVVSEVLYCKTPDGFVKHN